MEFCAKVVEHYFYWSTYWLTDLNVEKRTLSKYFLNAVLNPINYFIPFSNVFFLCLSTLDFYINPLGGASRLNLKVSVKTTTGVCNLPGRRATCANLTEKDALGPGGTGGLDGRPKTPHTSPSTLRGSTFADSIFRGFSTLTLYTSFPCGLVTQRSPRGGWSLSAS